MNKEARINQSKEMKKQHQENRLHNVAIALARIGKIWHDYRIPYAQKTIIHK